MTKYKCIEEILKNIDKNKYQVPDDWNFAVARKLFKEPEVLDPVTIDLKWKEPDEEGLVKFLCGDRQFNEERVRSGAQKVHKSLKTATQGRLDSFFKVIPSSSPAQGKRRVEEKKSAAGNKKAKTASKPGRKPK